ncbi:MAG: hypothetical protein ACRCZF_08970, partial [Gemmataceae bacterium]
SNWRNQAVLAMALAEAGEFEPAVLEQQKAITQLKAEKDADAEDLKQVEAQLELYRAKKPYRDEKK